MLDSQGRVKKYLNQSLAARDTNYQAYQSKIALGSGAVTGMGLMQSKQKLFYLPEAFTDFIYAVIGEELGFFGCAAVLAGFLIILLGGLQGWWLAPDGFGRFLAVGVT